MFVVIVAAAAAAAGAAFAASVWSKCYKFEVLKQISNGLFLIYDRPYIREQTYHTKAGWLAGWPPKNCSLWLAKEQANWPIDAGAAKANRIAISLLQVPPTPNPPSPLHPHPHIVILVECCYKLPSSRSSIDVAPSNHPQQSTHQLPRRHPHPH